MSFWSAFLAVTLGIVVGQVILGFVTAGLEIAARRAATRKLGPLFEQLSKAAEDEDGTPPRIDRGNYL